jgi:NAD(P)-dependent dehydrogenase (short-subunit alcohol dehydrogenase family)
VGARRHHPPGRGDVRATPIRQPAGGDGMTGPMDRAAVLQDRVVLVTGAGQGIGRATALKAAEHGAFVIVADLDEARGGETSHAISAGGGRARFAACDVTDPDHVRALVDDIVEREGQLDAAVNNAGTEGAVVVTHEYPLDTFDRVIALNLRAVFVCMQEQLRVMTACERGAIVNVSSIAGFRGFANFSAYNATKHAVVGLTRTAALEYATTRLRVNSVAPGFCVTPMVTDRGLRAQPGSADYHMLEELHPMKRLGEPEEIAEAVVWLCSDAASFVTGHNLAVDGGYLAR